MIEIAKQRITQYKKFILWAHPNFCFAKTSFMLEPLSEKPTNNQEVKQCSRLIHMLS